MADKRSLEFHISADLPIESKAEDKLNRVAFAEALGKVICSWRDKPSLVIGLFGDWGSGKSSLKNLVLESLLEDAKDSPLVVQFSPWQVSGQELLSETFFREIGHALGKTGPAEDAVVKRRVARWKKYAGVLSLAGSVARALRSVPPVDHHTAAIAGSAAAIDTVATVVKTGAETVEAEGAANTLTLSELKENIREDLSSLDRPILVILDDLDRLTKEEIRHTLQLVKANADFPNIIYLLVAQKKSVVDALKDVAPDNALAYLEKIIQVSFDVPLANRRQLQRLLLNSLNDLLAGPALEARFSKDYWGAIFPHLFSLFRNMRDLNRFLGALSFHIQLFLNGTTFEVNPVDLIVLEAIRIFEPEVYRKIPEEKDVLTATPKWAHEKDADSDKKRIEDLIALASENNCTAIRKLLGEMFPPSKLRKGLQFEGSNIESRWFHQLRVCSYQAFDRYFQFATPEGDVSQADIDNLIRNMGDTPELEHILSSLAERDQLDVMLTRLSSLEESLPLEHASTFLAALYQVGAGQRRYSFFESSPSDRVRHITYWYLQRLSEEQRLTVMEDAIRRTRGLSLAVKTVQLLTRGFDAGSRALPFFQEQGNRDRLNQVALEAIQRSLLPDSEIAPAETLAVVSFWAYFDAPAAKQWLDGYLTSRLAIVQYLKSLVSVSDGTGGVREFIFVDSFKSLISIAELQSRVERHLTDDLTAEENELVRLFRKGVKKHYEGRDDPSMVWMDDDEAE
jgi:hypothetical protein